MSRFIFILSILILFILFACERRPYGYWREPQIAVIADSTEWQVIQEPLESYFEHIIRTPQPEKEYELFRVQENQLDQYSAFRYIIVAGTFESKGNTGKLLQQILADSSIRAGVQQDKFFMFSQRDQWSTNQLVAFVIADNLANLKARIEKNGQYIYKLFDRNFKDYLITEMYRKREQVDIEEELMKSYGWSFRVQTDYFIAQEVPEEGFLWMRRMYPERWIFVRWIENADTTLLNSDWVIDERNRIGRKYYGNDRTVDAYLESVREAFLGRPAIITTGLWENEEKVAGGPFRNFTFYDEFSKTLFMIDVAVYAPNQDKLPYLRRMEIMAHTFKTLADG